MDAVGLVEKTRSKSPEPATSPQPAGKHSGRTPPRASPGCWPPPLARAPCCCWKRLQHPKPPQPEPSLHCWKCSKLKPSLSLDGCKSLCEFWELPKDTTELALSSSTIKELRNASIESAVGLTAIQLNDCESLVSLPMNIWKLKSLKSLDLNHCSNFQNFPEISEVMEYLEFLNLSDTAVKELPPSIRNLIALRELDLHNCKNLEVVSDYLFRLTSLQELDLSETEIKSLPASIKQATQLSRLFLNDCKSLESLPELPTLLQHLEADGCTSLKTMSSQLVQKQSAKTKSTKDWLIMEFLGQL